MKLKMLNEVYFVIVVVCLCIGFVWYSIITKYFAACLVFLLLWCSSSSVLSFEPLC